MESGEYTVLELDDLAIQVVELKLDIDELRKEIVRLWLSLLQIKIIIIPLS